MSADHPVWEMWAKTLRHWGMQAFAASLLEAVGPLTTLGAQLVYLSQPVINGLVPRSHVDALANMLDNPTETKQFIVYLREQNTL